MKDIYVTKPYLPDIKLVYAELEKIWKSRILSNNGPYHKIFEEEIAKYLGVKYVSLFNNCTTALLVAIRAMKLEGEIITTPFTFVASSSALIWNNLKPKFVDIELDSFNIDYEKIEKTISSNTAGILGVHSYGNPCNINELKRISEKHKLGLIYDGAAAFGSSFNRKTVLSEGDCSVVSFHATKILNTFEGGAVISSNKKLKMKIDQLKNFGMNENGYPTEFGINGKLSEFNSMLGILQLKHINNIIEKRKNIANIYNKKFAQCEYIDIPKFLYSDNYNFSYYPILIKENSFKDRNQIHYELSREGIFCKKYYTPLISKVESISEIYNSSKYPIAKYISENIICLPLYPDLNIRDQERVFNTLLTIIYSKN